ncbi:MAG: hypothetical protein RL078_1788 [Bacteroidota bacterium]
MEIIHNWENVLVTTQINGGLNAQTLAMSPWTGSSNHTNQWWLELNRSGTTSMRSSSNHTNQWWLEPRWCLGLRDQRSSNHTN